MRLIDADELKKMFMYAEDAEYAKWTLNGVISEIDDMPTVDVLDKIRAEIEDLDRYYDNDYFSINNCPMYKCNDVLQIIDKYKEQTE